MAARGASRSGDAQNDLLMLVGPVIFLLLWSGGYPVAKVALRHIEPFTLLSIRYGAALLILLALFAILRPPVPQRSIELIHIMVVGFLIQGVYFGLSYMSFNFGISVGAIALIVSLQPIVVGLLAPLFIDERVTIWRWIGLMLGLAGAALVIVARSAVEVTSLWGVLTATGALFGMSAAAIYEKRFGNAAHPVTSNVLQYAIGFAVLTPVALQTETLQIDWNLELIGCLGYLVVGNSLIAITLLLAMIRRGGASRVSAFLFLVPPLAALIAWVMIGEVMPPVAWAGFALAAAGVLLATRGGSLVKKGGRTGARQMADKVFPGFDFADTVTPLAASIDSNGHVNVGYYGVFFDQAAGTWLTITACRMNSSSPMAPACSQARPARDISRGAAGRADRHLFPGRGPVAESSARASGHARSPDGRAHRHAGMPLARRRSRDPARRADTRRMSTRNSQQPRRGTIR